MRENDCFTVHILLPCGGCVKDAAECLFSPVCSNGGTDEAISIETRNVLDLDTVSSRTSGGVAREQIRWSTRGATMITGRSCSYQRG
jgi:hypothetical protein